MTKRLGMGKQKKGTSPILRKNIKRALGKAMLYSFDRKAALDKVTDKIFKGKK